MHQITKPAVKIEQGNKTLLVTSFTVAELSIKNFVTIDRLDPEAGTGFQRVLQEERANRLARYVAEAWEENRQAFLPTSVFLANEKNIEFDESRGQISFDTRDVCPFDVVDGQHRIEGLIRAAAKNPELRQFPIAANIAVNVPRVEQMLQFYVVNTTQRAVDPSVGQQIRARLTPMLKTADLPYIPSWIKPQIEGGKDRDAIAILDFLNSDSESPWRGRILMANEDRRPEHSVTQKFFVGALKSSVLHEGHPLALEGDKDQSNRVFRNYWIAVKDAFTTPETENNTVVFKSTGVQFFCRVSASVINCANRMGSYRVSDFKDILGSVRPHLPEDLLPTLAPEWWKSGNAASGMNSGAADKAATKFAHAVTAAAKAQGTESAL